MKRLFILLLLCMAMLGCAGTPFSWDRAREVKLGMTTKQVIDIMGQPTTASWRDNNTQVFVWVDVNAFTGTKSFSVHFTDRKATSVPPIPDGY